jgi:hypothetical protein
MQIADADCRRMAVGCLGAQAQFLDRGIVAIVAQIRQVEKREREGCRLARAQEFHFVPPRA